MPRSRWVSRSSGWLASRNTISYIHSRMSGSSRLKLGSGRSQHSGSGSSIVPVAGPRRSARSVTTSTARPGRAWWGTRKVMARTVSTLHRILAVVGGRNSVLKRVPVWWFRWLPAMDTPAHSGPRTRDKAAAVLPGAGQLLSVGAALRAFLVFAVSGAPEPSRCSYCPSVLRVRCTAHLC